MKRYLILLLALLLTGCGAAAPPAQEAATETARPPAQVTAPPPPPAANKKPAEPEEPKQEPLCLETEIRTIEGTAQTEDGVPLVEYRFCVPELAVLRGGNAVEEAVTEEEAAALTAAETFNNRFAVWYAEETLDEAAKTARTDLEFHKELELEWFGGHTHELACSVYETGDLISVAGAYYSYTGGAHPNTYLLSWNFDRRSGTFLGPEILAGMPELQDAVTEELLRQAREKAQANGMAPEEFFWEGYETIIADWPNYAVSLSEAGLSVAFSPYELAAYAAGAQEFCVDYEILRSHLDPAMLEMLGLQAE